MKITLTRPALDRLLGDDDELTVQIRHAAAKEIIEKHIATAVRDETFDKIKWELREATNQEIERSLGELKTVCPPGHLYDRKEFVLNVDVRQSIKKYVKGLVEEMVVELVEGLDIKKQVKEGVERRVKAEVKDKVRQRFQDLEKQAYDG